MILHSQCHNPLLRFIYLFRTVVIFVFWVHCVCILSIDSYFHCATHLCFCSTLVLFYFVFVIIGNGIMHKLFA